MSPRKLYRIAATAEAVTWALLIQIGRAHV